MVEIMAPAGSYDSLQAAIKAGAGSVYFGVEDLNMRKSGAKNFKLDELEEIVKICGCVKTYLTLNTVMYDEDLSLLKKICDRAKEAGITAVIACDMAVIQYANSIGLEVHISTQTNVSNIEAVKFFSKFADVVVLARELKLEQIKEICRKVKEENVRGPKGELVEIEVFVHGALCVSISGKCYMSLASYNKSANRGECIQACRRKYRVVDEETDKEFVIDNKYVMSPKDLCMIKYLDLLLDAGVRVLKIEGRGRKPEYVSTVVRCYKEAVDAIEDGTFKDKDWVKELESVYNRGFWHGGYYMGESLDMWSGKYGSQATTEKVYVGVVENYFDKAKVAAFTLEAGGLKVGDKVLITGPTTGVVEDEVKSIFNDMDENVEEIGKGYATVPISEKVRKNDKVFVVNDRRK